MNHGKKIHYRAPILPAVCMPPKDMGPETIAALQEDLKCAKLEIYHQKQIIAEQNSYINAVRAETMQADVIQQNHQREVDRQISEGRRSALRDLLLAMQLGGDLYQGVEYESLNTANVKEIITECFRAKM